jgi:hypothetical protein
LGFKGLTTRELWSSTETPLEQWEMGEGNENLVYPSVGLQEFFYMP